MQKTGMKRHWASFMALVLLSLFPFFSCEKAGPDNSETDKQENAENGKEPDARSLVPVSGSIIRTAPTVRVL